MTDPTAERRLLAAMYLLHLSTSGAWGPYLAPWLRSSGFDGAAVGSLLAGMAMVRVLSGPAWALVADTTRRSALLLRIAAGIGALAAAVAITGASPAWTVAGLMAGSFARAPITPLLDATVMRVLEVQGTVASYGRVRLWGSVGFLLAGGLSGWLAEWSPIAPLWMTVGLLALAAFTGRYLPEIQVTRPRGPGLEAALATLASSPRILLFWAVVTLHGVALSAYDSFYALHITELGLASRWTGAALVVGVLSEIAFFAALRRWQGLADPLVWVGLGCVVGAARWAVVAYSADPLVLTAAALSHGIVFAVWWAGALEVVRRDLPERVRASAVALLLSTAYGIGPAICGLLAANLADMRELFEVSAWFSLGAAVIVPVVWMLPRPAGDRG